MELITILLLGLILGSFSTALAFREGSGLSWVSGRSACPACKTTLGIPDLIPVFSWLALRGKCRHCRAPIPACYPLTELAVLIGCLGAWAIYGFTPQTGIIMLSLPILAALFLIDMDHMILPDRLNIGLAIAGIIFAALNHDLINALGAAALYAALAWTLGKTMSLILKKETLGFGDVKFFAAAGIWLGLSYIPVFLMLSGVAGVAYGLTRGRGKAFPFGPALILALYACLLLRGTGFTLL